jgi:hypothetical protein
VWQLRSIPSARVSPVISAFVRGLFSSAIFSLILLIATAFEVPANREQVGFQTEIAQLQGSDSS